MTGIKHKSESKRGSPEPTKRGGFVPPSAPPPFGYVPGCTYLGGQVQLASGSELQLLGLLDIVGIALQIPHQIVRDFITVRTKV